MLFIYTQNSLVLAKQGSKTESRSLNMMFSVRYKHVKANSVTQIESTNTNITSADLQ